MGLDRFHYNEIVGESYYKYALRKWEHYNWSEHTKLMFSKETFVFCFIQCFMHFMVDLNIVNKKLTKTQLLFTLI